MQITEARFADAAHTLVDLTLDGVPGNQIPADHWMLAGYEGEIADHAEPEAMPEPIPATISDRQFAQVLALDGVITQDEALAWAARGDLPAALADALEHVPEEGGQRFGARMLLAAATAYERAHPLVPLLGSLLTNPATGRAYDAPALDDIWTRGAGL